MSKTAPRLAAQSSSSTLQLLLTGLVFHLAFIPIVFDCYFKSPVANGMQHFGVEEADAQRLVLIVGDGLRADLLFNVNPFPNIPGSPTIVAPYLRSIMEQRGAFGVSHTRVPTESRPGHVAIIAGMYEDVSAVTKGWKTNPVDFDSVFNQSSTTFSFGSPDILPMFARGAIPGKVHMWCYDESEEDFTKDATALDIWSYDQLATLLSNSTHDASLHAALHSPKVLFFLHLLGLDTTGHSYRPHSKEYMRNIQVVDDISAKTERLMKDFYEDDKTAFIFTADHGMSNIGNHGDGDPDSTRTPLVAWGAGIRGPIPDRTGESHTPYSSTWNISHLLRVDVNQADIAPMMSSLIGIKWPANSVGVLPDITSDTSASGYLDIGPEQRARLAAVNAKVILEQYRVKHDIKESRTLFYKPFKPLSANTSLTPSPGADAIASLESYLHEKRWEDAILHAHGLINTSLDGLRYLQTYDWLFLRSLATAGYIGWSAYAACFVLSSNAVATSTASRSLGILGLASTVFIALSAVLISQSAPLTYYIYVFFPVFFWHAVFQSMWNTSQISSLVGKLSFTRGAMWAVFSVMLLQGMVLGYTHRSLWSFGFVILGVVWPLCNKSNPAVKDQRGLIMAWAASCLIASIFPILSVEKQESMLLICIGGTTMAVLGLFILYTGKPVSFSKMSFMYGEPFAWQIILLLFSTLITADSVYRLQMRLGLPRFNQLSGWVVLGLSSTIPFLYRKRLVDPDLRLLSYFWGFAPWFVILSISVEGLFYSSFALVVYLWTLVEPALSVPRKPDGKSSGNTRQLQLDDLRIALTFLFFVQVAFFGTGNVASISSFYLEPVYRLVPIFSPFLMALLLIIKIIAPFVILSAAFATLNYRLSLPPFSLFTIALSLTDVMTLTFFYRVRDQGSWLEIGQSISFFVISSLLLVWSAGICSAGQWLMKGSLPPLSRSKLCT